MTFSKNLHKTKKFLLLRYFFKAIYTLKETRNSVSAGLCWKGTCCFTLKRKRTRNHSGCCYLKDVSARRLMSLSLLNINFFRYRWVISRRGCKSAVLLSNSVHNTGRDKDLLLGSWLSGRYGKLDEVDNLRKLRIHEANGEWTASTARGNWQ